MNSMIQTWSYSNKLYESNKQQIKQAICLNSLTGWKKNLMCCSDSREGQARTQSHSAPFSHLRPARSTCRQCRFFILYQRQIDENMWDIDWNLLKFRNDDRVAVLKLLMLIVSPLYLFCVNYLGVHEVLLSQTFIEFFSRQFYYYHTMWNRAWWGIREDLV